MYICDMYEQSLKYHCQRYSNNSKPLFSDEEILTIYFFVGHEQKYTLIKDIHNFAKEYLRDWFPNLVSYQTFNYRLNRMAGAVRELSSQLLRMFRPSDCQDDTVIVDSMPIITCCGRNRTGKVARDIADKGYCSTKNLYYHGLKLHMVGYRRKGHLPHPCQIALSPASENKEGQWKDFMGMYKPEILKSKLFSVYLKHRKDAPASYVYLTLPATTQQKVRDFDSRSVHIIRNDKKAQAAIINDLCYASVYHPTNLLIDNDNPIAISEPGTYIIHIKKKEIVSHESFALQLTNK